MNVMNIFKLLFNSEQQLFNSENGAPHGGRIPFEFISEKLIAAVRAARDKIGDKITLPDTYVIRFSPVDRAHRKYVESILIDELKAAVLKEIDRWKGVVPAHNITVIIDTDAGLDQGHFYIDCMYRSHRNSRSAGKQGVPRKMPELSNVTVPPANAPEMTSGAFVQTLLNPDLIREHSPESVLWCRVELNDARGCRTFMLPEGSYFVGRDRSAHIVLDSNDRKISRKHLSLNVDAGGVSIQMIGRNGGIVNGEFLKNGVEYFAAPGDKIRIGGAVLTVNVEKL